MSERFILEGVSGDINVRAKPIIGGEMGRFGFWIGSVLCSDGDLDAVIYMVFDPRSHYVISNGKTVSDALASGREKTRGLNETAYSIKTKAREAEIRQKRAARKAEVEALLRQRQNIEPKKGVPKRRVAIFNKTSGACFYCSTPLDLEGAWHIEHKMPKALGGKDVEENLVPACVPCNMKKRDRTADEFMAQGGTG